MPKEKLKYECIDCSIAKCLLVSEAEIEDSMPPTLCPFDGTKTNWTLANSDQ